MRHYAATIGFFDGVHRGHRYLIGQVLRQAALLNLDSALITFEQHPRQFSGGDIPLLTTFEERSSQLAQTGVTEIFCFQYPLIQPYSAREFMQILHERCAVDVLLMGYDHRFGSDLALPSRTLDDYIREGREVGIEVQIIEQSPEGNMSSSKIRKALLAGQLEEANQMLGYSYTLCGKVVHGRGLGRTLGFPTANLSVDAGKLIPAQGVYACRVCLNPSDSSSPFLPALVNIGTNPTLGENPCTIEVHVPGVNEDLYGRSVTLMLEHYLRPERHFDSLSELQAQICSDLTHLQD